MSNTFKVETRPPCELFPQLFRHVFDISQTAVAAVGLNLLRKKKCRKQFQFSDLFSIRFTEGMCVVNDVVVEQSSGVYPSSPIPVRSVKQTEIKLIAWLHCLVPLFSTGKDVERNFQSEEHFSGDSRFRQVCDRLTVIIIIHPVRTLDLAACLGSANEIKT